MRRVMGKRARQKERKKEREREREREREGGRGETQTFNNIVLLRFCYAKK